MLSTWVACLSVHISVSIYIIVLSIKKNQLHVLQIILLFTACTNK